MASSTDVPSFDDIIQAGRERKRAEALASEIFGKGRRTSSPLHGGRNRSGGSHSLANRITKPGQRATSSSPAAVTKSRPAPNRDTTSRGKGVQKNLFTAANSISSQKIFNENALGGREFSIKGAAGPYVVLGSNFAPGTTSADIQSAMEAVAGEMLSCVITSSYPTVIAEMVFADRSCADKIITTFNNQKADGRLLRVSLKDGPPTYPPEPVVMPSSITTAVSRPQITPQPQQNKAPRELIPEKANDFGPRSVNDRRADPEFQDGRYGFASKEDEMEMDVDDQPAPSRTEPVRESRNEARNSGHHEDRYDSRERYGYRQGYSRDTRSDRRDYESRDGHYRNGNHRPAEPSHFYSSRPRGDDYSNHRPRGRGFR